MASGSSAGATGYPGGQRRRPLLESSALPSWILAIDLVLCVVLLLIARLDFGWVLLAHVLFLSLLTFLLFGLDKWRAKRELRRVSEVNLHLLSLLGGALGGLCGMALFKHKGRHLSFRILLPLSLFAHGVLLVWFLVIR